MRGVKVNGEALLSARQRAGFTQVALALAADVDAKTIRKAERGERIDMLPLTRLAKALEMNTALLIVGEVTDDTVQNRYREIVTRWNRAWNERNMDKYIEYYHEDAVLHLPGKPQIPFGGDHRGKAEIRRATELAWLTVPQDPHPLEEATILYSEQGIAIKGHTKIYLPNGEKIALPSLQTLLFVDDLIIDHDVQFDTWDFLNRIQPAS